MLVDIISHPYLVNFWTLLLVVIIEKNTNWPDKFHPLSLLKVLALRMADKVLPSNNDSIKQQNISGGLAFVLLLLPVIAIIFVFIYLSEFPLFFEGLLLLIALRFQNIQSTSSKVSNYLWSDKKILAKQTLASIVLRDTDNLSPLGIAKANCETLLLRFNYQYSVVIFWFMLSGGAGAIIYRALYEYSQCWNIKLERFKHFGRPINTVVKYLQWPASLFTALSLCIVSMKFEAIKALISFKKVRSLRLYLLNLGGQSLNLALSGAAFYEQKKIRQSTCGSHQQVTLQDIKRTQKIIQLTIYTWLTFSFLTYTITYALMK